MIWVVSSNILWRSLALFMNDKWTVRRSMGSAINWNQAPCLRRYRPSDSEISSFQWFGMCFHKGTMGGNGSEHLAVLCPSVVCAKKMFWEMDSGFICHSQVWPGGSSNGDDSSQECCLEIHRRPLSPAFTSPAPLSQASLRKRGDCQEGRGRFSCELGARIGDELSRQPWPGFSCLSTALRHAIPFSGK